MKYDSWDVNVSAVEFSDSFMSQFKEIYDIVFMNVPIQS